MRAKMNQKRSCDPFVRFAVCGSLQQALYANCKKMQNKIKHINFHSAILIIEV